MRIEADEATDLDDGDPPLGHQPTDVTQARPQSTRNLVHGEERRRRTLLAAFGTAQGTGGRPRGTAGEGTASGPALAVGRLSAPSLPLGTGGAVVTLAAHRKPLSARRRWTRSAKVMRRTISSLATASRSSPKVSSMSEVPLTTAKATRYPTSAGIRLRRRVARLRSRINRSSVAPWASDADCTACQRGSTGHRERLESALGERKVSHSPVP